MLNVEVDVKQSTRSSSGNTPITPAIVVGGAIRLFAGGTKKDVADVT
jgi:hypothetical protein